MNGNLRFLGRRIGAVAALLLLAAGVQPLLGAGPGVSGRVFALDDKGLIVGIVPGAAIEFKDQGGKIAARLTADKNSYYQTELPPGVYVFKVQADGFKDEDAGRAITLKRSDGYAVHNFSLSRGKTDTKPKPVPPVEIGTLKGRVLEKTADGKLLGIPGARVALRNPKNTPQLTEVVVRGPDGKEQGWYEVVLPAGTYHASVAAVGFEMFVDTQPISIEAGKAASRDFVLTRPKPSEPTGQGIRGTITVHDPRRPSGTLPPVKVSITSLLEPGESAASFSPDAKGSYRRDLRPGRYQFVAEAQGYRTASSGPRDVLAGRYTVVNFRLVPELPKDLLFAGSVYERVGEQARRPLPGATVLLRRQGEALADAQRSTSDSQGKVTLKVASPGSYQALARMEGYEPAGVQVEIRAGGDNRADIELVKTKAVPPPPQVALHLRVFEGKGDLARPLPEAHIVIRQEGRTVASSSSDRDGRHRFPLPAGSYRVDVTRPGYDAARLDITLTDRDVSRDITLTRTIVSKEATLNLDVVERLQTAVKPIQGAEIVISQQGRPVTKGQSGPDGRYTARLPAGSYRVDVTRPSFTSGRVDITLATEDIRREIVLTRAPVAELKLALNLRVVGESGVGPVSGAQVAILHQGQRIAAGQSDRDGRYRETGLRAGSYRIEVTRTDFQPAHVDITLTDRDVSRDITLTRLVTRVALQLQVAEKGKTALKPVAGAEIVISQPGRPGTTGQSGPDGRYTSRLPAGSYRVDVTRTGYTAARVEVTLVERDVSREIVLVPREPEKVALELLIEEPLKPPAFGPVPGAEVVISHEGRRVASGQSGRDGHYSVPMPAGTYTVEVNKPGYKPAADKVTLGSQDVKRRIVLARLKPPPPEKLALDLRIVEEGTTRPVAGAQVAILHQGERVAAGQSDRDGHYREAGLRAGGYRIEVSRPGYQPARVDVTLTDRDVSRQVSLSRAAKPLPPQGALQLQIRGPDRKGIVRPLPATQIVISGPGDPRSGRSDGEGRFSVSLPPGKYRVKVTHPPEFRPAEQDVEVGSGTVTREIVLTRVKID